MHEFLLMSEREPHHYLGITERKNKSVPIYSLQQQLEKISRLPRAKQHFVSEILDTVLQQAAR